jgi:hypothetical protein
MIWLTHGREVNESLTSDALRVSLPLEDGDGRGADRATRSKCVKEAAFHGDAVMLLERTIRESDPKPFGIIDNP